MKRNIRIAGSAEALRSYLQETIDRSEFRLQKVKLADQNEWSIKDGALSHFSNGFFHVAGVRNRRSNEEHLVLYQPQSALTGLILCKHEQEVYLLLQARVEPGLVNVGQYGPSIQSTAANYLRAHGGKETSYVELFRNYSPVANPLGNNIQFDLGRRYFQKHKTLSYVEVPQLIETEENMIWVPLRILAGELASANFINPDLRSLLSVFDWDRYLCPESKAEPERRLGEEKRFPFLANELGNDEWQLIALDQLQGWEIGPYGVRDDSHSGIWVDMFQVSSFTREVTEWVQPLMCCANDGLVVQLLRFKHGRYEFLITTAKEFGITGQWTALPSFTIYPGDNTRQLTQLFDQPSLRSSTILSEEGGRFFKNESIYRVLLVEDDFEIGEQQQWVTAEALKTILQSSSRASLQLRCSASLVLDLLYPAALGSRT